MPPDSETPIRFRCLRLQCGQLTVLVGAGRACDLASLSFADVLDETAQSGYQRPFDSRHSREFRQYIESAGATTIPLTFNLRGHPGEAWSVTDLDSRSELVELAVRVPQPGSCGPVMSQVDCQHRLGSMTGSPIVLTFQCYLGLSAQEEMAIFSVINGKAKGLSSSLLDFHTTKLTPDLETLHLELYIAKTLHDDKDSVWFGKLILGGATPGTKRKVSLRSLQTATKLLLQRSLLGSTAQLGPQQKYQAVRAFWTAVSRVWTHAWEHPRTHLLTKGVGVSALSMLGGDIMTALLSKHESPDVATFTDYLRPLTDVDWSSNGSFKAFGGRHGASAAHKMLAQRLFTPGPALMAGSARAGTRA